MRPVRHPGPRLSAIGLLMAVLALLGQVAFGLAAPAQAAPGVPGLLASPFGDIPICHSGAPGAADDGAPVGHAHHGMQCALCPACHALAAAAVLPRRGVGLDDAGAEPPKSLNVLSGYVRSAQLFENHAGKDFA